MILERELGKEIGWYGLVVASDKVLDKLAVNINGYSSDKEAYTLWSHTDLIKIANPIFYTTSQILPPEKVELLYG